MKKPKSFSLIAVLIILLGYTELAQAFYDPNTGSFLSRDPIEERGGENLYAFVRNDAVNTFDLLGMISETAEYSREKGSVSNGKPNFDDPMVTASHTITVSADDSQCKLEDVNNKKCCKGDVSVKIEFSTKRPDKVTLPLTLGINSSGLIVGDQFHRVTGPEGAKRGAVYTTGQIDLPSAPCSLGLCYKLKYTYALADGKPLTELASGYNLFICINQSETECGTSSITIDMDFIDPAVAAASAKRLIRK